MEGKTYLQAKKFENLAATRKFYFIGSDLTQASLNKSIFVFWHEILKHVWSEVQFHSPQEIIGDAKQDFLLQKCSSLSNIEQFIPGYSGCPASGAPGGLAAWLIFQIVSSPERKIIHSNFKEA